MKIWNCKIVFFILGDTGRKGLKLSRGEQNLRRGAFNHSLDGYLLIGLTPVLSFAILFSLFITLGPPGQSYLYSLIDAAFTVSNVSIVVLLIIGIALYMYGYVRREAQPSRRIVIFLFFGLLVWGVFTYIVAMLFLGMAVDRSMNPEMRALTNCDYISYWVWEIKGIFGIGTGVLLATTSLLKRHAQQTQN